MKRSVKLNSNWFFSMVVPQDLTAIPENAESVTVPHTWNIYDLKRRGSNTRGRYCYQRELPVPLELSGYRLFLEFKGAGPLAELYIDGKKVGTHEGGFTSFCFEITDFVTPGRNHVITMLTDSTERGKCCPVNPHFAVFGGIYRDVSLIVSGKSHFALTEDGSKGVFISTKMAGSDALVAVAANISNPINYDVVSFTIYDSAENAIGTATAHPKQAEAIMRIHNPSLWNGTASPYLYTLRAQLIRDGVILDRVDIPFGIRNIEIKSSGFYLNGKRTEIKGISLYQDRAKTGIAASDEQIRKEIQLLKELGANAVRLNCFPPDESVLDYCDSEGIAVWLEIPFGNNIGKNSPAFKNARQQLTELIKQYYNHPSIVAWGINCPKWHAGDSSVAFAQAEDLARLARSLDKTRVCVFTEQVDADTPVFPQSAGAFNADIDLLDEFSAERALRTLELMSEANPDLPISVSFSTELSPEKSANVLLENAFKAADERGFIWGVFAGPLFDFAKRTREIGTEFEITEDIPAEDEPTEETSEETKAEETAEIAAPAEETAEETEAEETQETESEETADNAESEESEKAEEAEAEPAEESPEEAAASEKAEKEKAEATERTASAPAINGYAENIEISSCGFVSYDRQQKRDSFYLIKAMWSKSKFIYIAEENGSFRSKRKCSIRVYSNLKDLRLTVNGKEKKSKTLHSENGVFIFNDVVLAKGENSIVASCDYEIGITDKVTIIRQRQAGK
jgi:beta-galactosidase